jgi:alpha-tubulin suppressor-like RCC1 family protein
MQKLQLGLGDRTQRNMPCIVPGMKDKGKCVYGACGKFHTVVIMEDGESYSWGFNGMGQTGTGEVRLWIRAFLSFFRAARAQQCWPMGNKLIPIPE